jgi:putative DNA primase/helicase
MEECYVGVEAVCDVYLKEAAAITDDIKALSDDNKDEKERLKALRKAYFERVKRLRSGSGATRCLQYSHRIEDPIAIRGDELDINPWLLACLNGVLDLRSGKLRDGRPEDYVTKFVPHEWRGIDVPAPAWESFLNASLDGDPMTSDEERHQHRDNVIPFVRRALGYGITGLSTEHMFLVLNGQGRNGKGVLVETFRYCPALSYCPDYPANLSDFIILSCSLITDLKARPLRPLVIAEILSTKALASSP